MPVPEPATLGWARRRDPVRWILGAMVTVWAGTFVTLGWIRHVRFATFGFDLGIYDQGIWLLSRLQEPFVTVKGLNLFGHHLNAALVLLAPFYRLGAGPLFLLVVQVAAQASGAVAVFLLARDRFAERWLALVPAGALLLNPTYQFLAWEYFHPDTLAVAPLLFAYWAARAERWRLFAVAVVLAAACKEDVALVVAGLGLLVWLRGNWRVGAVTALAGLGWFVLATRVLMRSALGGLNPFYENYFGDFGNSAGAVVRGVLTRPQKVLELARQEDRLAYYWGVFAPFGFLPAAAYETTVLVAGPMLAVAVLTTDFHARDIRYHYSALVVAGLAVAAVEAIAALGVTASAKRFLAGFVAATSLATTAAWGPSPLSTRYRVYWPLSADRRVDVKRAAAALVPARASVSGTYDFVPHLTHRTAIYQFPEPWEVFAWGIAGEGMHDPAGVRWLVVDRQKLYDDRQRRLFGSLLAGQFTVRFDRDDVVVAERVAPPA